ncbi:GPW/gp25 family protein [Sphingobacterium sp. Mn56C]|uniref:GPW/gp25 family protein n=1 Tax=Sphingobacterium sp. Mn56C TaxID=3395261 RepID=UPI003BDF5F5B
MIHLNYNIPIDTEKLINKQHNDVVCSDAESIAQNIMLLITTKKREHRYDLDFGNAVWDLEFDNAVTTVEWEALFIKSMKEQIGRYEKRINTPKIEIHMEYVAHTYETKMFSEIRKKAKIAINAKLTDSGENFSFMTELYLSPMSID